MSKGNVKWLDDESFHQLELLHEILGRKESRVSLGSLLQFPGELLPRTPWLPFSPGESPGERPAAHI